MKNEEFIKANFMKILIPVIVAAMAIYIWQKGFDFGQWLYHILH